MYFWKKKIIYSKLHWCHKVVPGHKCVPTFCLYGCQLFDTKIAFFVQVSPQLTCDLPHSLYLGHQYFTVWHQHLQILCSYEQIMTSLNLRLCLRHLCRAPPFLALQGMVNHQAVISVLKTLWSTSICCSPDTSIASMLISVKQLTLPSVEYCNQTLMPIQNSYMISFVKFSFNILPFSIVFPVCNITNLHFTLSYTFVCKLLTSTGHSGESDINVDSQFLPSRCIYK